MDSQAPSYFLLMRAFEGLRFDTANITAIDVFDNQSSERSSKRHY